MLRNPNKTGVFVEKFLFLLITALKTLANKGFQPNFYPNYPTGIERIGPCFFNIYLE
jgi:hypothetical protein